MGVCPSGRGRPEVAVVAVCLEGLEVVEVLRDGRIRIKSPVRVGKSKEGLYALE
jgi:hypothetical protein